MSKKILSVLLVAVVFVSLFIFSNSMKTPQQTHADSGVIVDFVKRFADRYISISYNQLNFIIRKFAHFFEFSLLGMSVMTFYLYDKKKCFGYCLFYVLLIAVADEHIQRFTGRTSMTTDIIIDFFGALAGFFIVYIIYKIIIFIKCSEKQNDNGRS